MAHSDASPEAVGAGFSDLNAAADAFPGDIDEIPTGDGPPAVEPEETPDVPEQEIPALPDDEAPADPEGQQDEPEKSEEPELPAIDPPTSWNAEAKEAFSQLPPEMQAIVSEREGEREKYANGKAQEAADARKQANEAAQTQLRLQETLARQLSAIAEQYAPRPPDPQLARTDPMAYQQQHAIYQAQTLEHDKLMGQVNGYNQQLERQYQQQGMQAIQEDAQRVAPDLPEVNDQSAYQALLPKLTPIARELGYPEDRIANAYPTDVLAMKRAAVWKEKATKYDALQSKKMTAVRAGKKTAKPNATQPIGSAKARNRKAASERLKQSGSLADAAGALPDFKG